MIVLVTTIYNEKSIIMIVKVVKTSIDLLASADFIIQIVEQRTASMSECGDPEEVVRTNLRLLFGIPYCSILYSFCVYLL